MNQSLRVAMPVPENQPADPVRNYRALLAAEGDSAVVQALLAQALYDTGDYTGAVAAADAALRGHPTDGVARITRASALNALCRFEAAAADFAVLAQAHPGRAAILIGLGTAYAEAGQPREAIAALMQAIAAEPGNAEAAAALGAVCARTGNAAAAITACRYALTLDPDQVIAHQNLAALLAADDPAVAVHRDAAYRRKQIVTIAGPPAAPAVLVLTCAAAANIPLDHLLPRRRFTQIRWFIDYACPDQDRELPPHDLVFNAIGDPDLMPDLRAPVERMLRETDRPVLNHPARIRDIHRAALPELLGGLPDVVVPPVTRVARDRHDENLWLVAHCLPVIVRPAGSHGGENLVCAATEAEATAAIARAPHSYVTDFYDYRAAADGLHRKYRVIFVDRVAYPYHLAIGPDWLVHYWTAGMAEAPARRAEEARFLRDPARAIGARAMAALGAIAARLDLDYAGIDFSVLPDGRVLVFEANATMLVHPETDAMFAYKNEAVAVILAAVDRMIALRSGRTGSVSG